MKRSSSSERAEVEAGEEEEEVATVVARTGGLAVPLLFKLQCNVILAPVRTTPAPAPWKLVERTRSCPAYVGGEDDNHSWEDDEDSFEGDGATLNV